MKIMEWLKTKYPQIHDEFNQHKLEEKRARARKFYQKMSKAYKEVKEKQGE